MDDYATKRQAIKDLMEYAVPEESMDEAVDLIDVYRDDYIGLVLLHEFYSFLPEAQNDYIREIRLVSRKQGIFLLAAMTQNNGYLYLVSSEGVEFQGKLAEGLWDRELLEFFGLGSREKFLKTCESKEQFQIYEPMDSDIHICPSCHTETGSVHELGCPVEVCPWCGGQLVHCSCRYEKLEVDSITSEKDLVRFEEILYEQGRVPYSPEQRPSFADEGPGVIID